ncbi:hypothetical protein D3C81_523580 [compost metagenome]
MAYTKLAIVRGEWQLDPDHVFRLYVRPTLEIIDRAGETHHVSAFATTARRSDQACGQSPDSVFYSTAYTGSAFGDQGQSIGQSTERGWLESLSPDQTFHMLGELSNNSSPIMGALILRSAIQWLTIDMEPDLVCIDEAIATNQFDEQFIEILKRFKVH